MCTLLIVVAIWHIIQQVKDDIAFFGASVRFGFNVDDLVVDLDSLLLASQRYKA